MSATDDPFATAAARTAELYRRHAKFRAGFVRGKLTWDPLYRTLARLVESPTRILDLGCGEGIALVLLSMLHEGVPGHGIDWDPRRLGLARQLAVPNLTFELSDLRAADIPPADCVLLLDVLHYLPPDSQVELVRKAAQAVLPGGMLLLREVNASGGWKAQLTMCQERLSVATGWQRARTARFRTADEWASELEACGLRVERESGSGRLPLANVILAGRRDPT